MDDTPTPHSLSSPEALFMEAQAIKWNERNDRQLRLWGVHGQDRIDNANVCLLNASAVGAETLKNMVLPGFGKFTIVDAHKVTEADLGVNFFVTLDSIGKSKAKAVTDCLAELNPDNVTGQFLEEDPRTIIEKEPDFFDSFNYIIATQLEIATVRQLAKLCWSKDKVLIIVRSYGLSGYVRIVTKSVEVIESKPDNEIEDLRLNEPWYELQNFCDEQDYSKMTVEQFRDTPFPVILMKATQQWRTSHQGTLPQSRDERRQFNELLHATASTRCPQGPPPNFQEAIAKSRHAYTVPEIPAHVERVLNHPRTVQLSRETPSFWFLARALKLFVDNEGHGRLPVQAKLPDMDTDTERYVRLQTLYRRKARVDMAHVRGHLQQLLSQCNREKDSISESDVYDFCKNAYYIHAFTYRTLEMELDAGGSSGSSDSSGNGNGSNNNSSNNNSNNNNGESYNVEEISNKLDEYPSVMPLYFCYLASERFHAKMHHYPGEHAKCDLNAESHVLKQILYELLTEYKMDSTCFDVDAYAREWTRWGAAELHNISALVGGVAAQELIKLCTKQRLPIQNTWLFNGMQGSSCTFNA